MIELDQFTDLLSLKINQPHIDGENDHQDYKYGIAQVGDIEIEGVAEKQDCQYIENQHVPFIAILFVKKIYFFRWFEVIILTLQMNLFIALQSIQVLT